MKKKYYGLLIPSIASIIIGCEGESTKNTSSPTNEYKSISGVVTSVIDGDTIKMSTNSDIDTIRLACIDAPESGQEYGNSSKIALSNMINGYTIDIHYNATDKYDRIIGFASNGKNINLKQVKNGQAWVYRDYCSVCEYYDAEVYARNNHLGLWANSNPVPPWIWRELGEAAKDVDWTYLYNDRCPSRPPNSGNPGDNPDEEYSCGRKKYCSEMHSCSEAMYYYEQCEVNRLDGDNDGIPCESLCQ